MTTVCLFYSTQCKHSMRFIDLVKKSKSGGIITDFICVDKKNGARPPEVSRYSVTEVPTIIIPELASKLQGTDAFSWLKEQDRKTKKSVEISGLDSYDDCSFGVSLDTDNRIAGDSDYIQHYELECNNDIGDYADILSRGNL